MISTRRAPMPILGVFRFLRFAPARSADWPKTFTNCFRLDLGWLDVLIEPQHIVGIVRFLDFHQTSTVRPVGRADKLVTRIAQLVDVHSLSKRLQLIARSLDPSYDLRLLCGSVPYTRHVYLITGLPQSIRHVTQIDAANSPAQRHND